MLNSGFRLIKRKHNVRWRECGPMGDWGRSLQLGTGPSPEGSSGARQAEFVRGPQVVNIHGVRPGREKPIGSRRARVNRRRSHHAARTWEDGGMECNLCPTELVVPMAGREGPRSNTRDRPGIRGFVPNGCWLLAARTARQQQQPARTCFRGRRGDSTRNHLKSPSQANPTPALGWPTTPWQLTSSCSTLPPRAPWWRTPASASPNYPNGSSRARSGA